MCRKPSFTWWDGLGRCVIYPVSVHVSGRQWDEKNILNPLSLSVMGTSFTLRRVNNYGMDTL